MARETVFPSKFRFFGNNKLVYRIRGHRPVRVLSVGKKEPHWLSGLEPVLCEDVQGIPGKDGIPVRTRFGMADMYAHGRTADILISEGADFPNPKTGRIHEGQNSFMFQIRKRPDKQPDILLCRDKRKIGIKPSHGELCGIPGFVKDIYGKETQLGNTVVHGAVRKILLLLEPADKVTQFIPGNILGHFLEDVGKIVQINPDVGRIRCYRMVSKTTKGDHLPELY